MLNFFLIPTAVEPTLSAHAVARIAAHPFSTDRAAEDIRREAVDAFEKFQTRFLGVDDFTREMFLVTEGKLLLSMAKRGDSRDRDQHVDHLAAARRRTGAPDLHEYVRRLAATFVRDTLAESTDAMCRVARVQTLRRLRDRNATSPSLGDTRADPEALAGDVSTALSVAADARRRARLGTKPPGAASAIAQVAELMYRLDASFAGARVDAPFVPGGCSPLTDHRAHDLRQDLPSRGDEARGLLLAVDIQP